MPNEFIVKNGLIVESGTSIITGSLAVGAITGSSPTENTLTLFPPLAGGSGEGGQLGLQATGGSFTSASFIDVYQNTLRILKGTNAGSVAEVATFNLQTNGVQFVGPVTASAYSGLPTSWLYAVRNTNQTISSGTWANRDVIFNDFSGVGIPYDTSTGIATLLANKTYKITARVAWLAGAIYTLKFRLYNQTTSLFTGPTVEMIQSPNGTFNISDNTLELIFPVGSSNVNISIRTTTDTNALTGEQIRSDLNTQLIIQQIA